jgi:hypothetical protein
MFDYVHVLSSNNVCICRSNVDWSHICQIKYWLIDWLTPTLALFHLYHVENKFYIKKNNSMVNITRKISLPSYICIYMPGTKLISNKWPSWPWSYSSWIYNYLCLSPLMLQSWWGRVVQHYVIKFVSDLRQVGGFLRGLRFPPPNKTDRHDITEILLKVALNTIIASNQTNQLNIHVILK